VVDEVVDGVVVGVVEGVVVDGNFSHIGQQSPFLRTSCVPTGQVIGGHGVFLHSVSALPFINLQVQVMQSLVQVSPIS
jgi:hypothetical protein